MPRSQGKGRLKHSHAGHNHNIMATDPRGCTERVNNYPQRYLQALRGERPHAGSPLNLRAEPAHAGCRDAVSRRQLVWSRTQAIQDRVGMLCAKVRKHGFQRAVITEIACTQEANKAYPGRDGYRPGRSIGPTKKSHDNLVSRPSVTASPLIAVSLPHRPRAHESLPWRPATMESTGMSGWTTGTGSCCPPTPWLTRLASHCARYR